MTTPTPDRATEGHRVPVAEPPRFSMRFTSTPRGARLARRMVVRRLADWGCAPETEAHQSMTLIAAELAANAVRHGHVPGRDFRLSLTVSAHTLRVEVTDTRGERTPRPRSNPRDAENGRGLLLVSALADRWAVTAHLADPPGKTVWAEVDVPFAVPGAPRPR